MAEGAEDCYEHEYEPEKFTVADRFPLEVLSVVPPPLEYMSALHSQQREISGRQVWCGSLLLAHALCGMQDDCFRQKRILELGSGTGLVGMVASKLGDPACVVLTDGDREAMDLLKCNLQNPFNKVNTDVAKAQYLRWGEEAVTTEFFAWCRTNWMGLFDEKVRFDVLLAGDVMYKEELPTLFFATAKSLLADSGTLWLCHVPRSTVTQEVVTRAAKDAGFCIEPYKWEEPLPQDCPPEDLERAVVYRVTKEGDI